MGEPATAALGCTALTTSKLVTSLGSVASISVAKCQTFASFRVKGWSSATACWVRSERECITLATAKRCSSLSLVEVTRCCAWLRSAAGLSPRAVLPAKTRIESLPPCTTASVSGVEPTKPSMANVAQSGYASAKRSRAKRQSLMPGALAIRSRASTTLCAAPS